MRTDQQPGTTSIRFVAIEEVPSEPARRPPDDDVQFLPDEPFARRNLIGRAEDGSPGPQAFVIEVPRHARTGAHFHPVDQFQVFFPSEGSWYQRDEMHSILVQYADAYTTYGPFGSRDRPFDFYTLRAEATLFNGFMPAARGQLVRRGRRHRRVALDQFDRSATAGAYVVHPVFEREADGLSADLVIAGPGARATLPMSEPNGGRYVCLLSGSLRHDGSSITGRVVGWWAPEEPAPTVEAGEDGFQLLVLQFPRSQHEPASAVG